MVFSVDSENPEEHDKNRCMNGVFELVINSIEELKKDGDYPIAIRTVITKSNYKQLPAIISKFNELGVDCIKLTNIENDEEGNFRLNLSDLEEFDNMIRKRIIKVLKECKYDDGMLRTENIKKIEYLFNKDGNVTYKDLALGHFSPDMVGNAKCNLQGHFFNRI